MYGAHCGYGNSIVSDEFSPKTAAGPSHRFYSRVIVSLPLLSTPYGRVRFSVLTDFAPSSHCTKQLNIPYLMNCYFAFCLLFLLVV